MLRISWCGRITINEDVLGRINGKKKNNMSKLIIYENGKTGRGRPKG